MPITQRDEGWAAMATVDQVAAAFNAGELDDLLARQPAHTAVGEVATPEWLSTASGAEIAAAYNSGDLDSLLGVPKDAAGSNHPGFGHESVG